MPHDNFNNSYRIKPIINLNMLRIFLYVIYSMQLTKFPCIIGYFTSNLFKRELNYLDVTQKRPCMKLES